MSWDDNVRHIHLGVPVLFQHQQTASLFTNLVAALRPPSPSIFYMFVVRPVQTPSHFPIGSVSIVSTHKTNVGLH